MSVTEQQHDGVDPGTVVVQARAPKRPEESAPTRGLTAVDRLKSAMVAVAQKVKERGKNNFLVRYIRQSISLQVVAGMGAVIVLVLAMLFVTVTYQVRGNVFEQRREQILADASIRFSQAQGTFDQSTASTPDQIQELANQVVSSLQSSSSSAGVVSTMLLRSPNRTVPLTINDIVDRDLVHLITTQMRHKTSFGDGQYYQSVAIPVANETVPGIIVGSLVSLPLAGEYELYTVYSLADEQATIGMILSTLAIGSIPVVLVLVLGLLLVTYRILRPVRTTAEAAMELAKGDLSVRVDPHGENEMAHLAHAFNDMAKSLADKINEYDELSQLEQRFVSDVSHELRTPLTTIRMAEEIIYDAREDFDPITARTAVLLHEQVDRLEKMLADLLEISRYDAQSAALDAEEVDLGEVVNKVVEQAKPLANKNGVVVTVESQSSRCTAQADHRRMERVLRNLVVNAIEHAERKPVHIVVAVNDSAAAVRVRDYGIGMDEQTCKQVFKRFFRADPARARTTGGTGLGLSIAHEDVALHGGSLTAWGELGKGSAFLVVIPRKVGQQLESSPLGIWPESDTETVPGITESSTVNAVSDNAAKDNAEEQNESGGEHE
ncbi:MAG: MtrAB system histidine kinase MtrB [Actinomycetaceae bacterium]|nr:MtrAB system histidine kinase MtrB [Actinomycetaceae bacterium]